MSSGEYAWVGKLVEAFGPAAAAFALVAAVLFWVIRKDHKELTTLNSRMIDVLTENSRTSASLAESVNHVAEANRITAAAAAETNRATADAITRQVDMLVRAFERRPQ